MRVVIQRVKAATVTINQIKRSQIGPGLLVLLGICEEDAPEDIDWLVNKIIQLRIFNDEKGIMNLSAADTHAEIMIVSQFTLFASYKKGNRPSYIKAAKPDIAIPLYENFCDTMRAKTKSTIATGVFGADMQVALVNDGPVTICMDSKNKE